MLRISRFLLLEKTGYISSLHMQWIHSLSSQLGAAARLGIKVILPFPAHQDLAVLRNLEPFEICFNAFHI